MRRMSLTMPGILRLILWPSIITLVVSVLRLVLQLQGVISPRSGGSFAWLGITWLAFVFGGWFGWRLSRSGSRPTLKSVAVWAVVPLIAIVAAVIIGFGSIDRADVSDAAFASLRTAVSVIALVAVGGAVFGFVLWARLALVLLVYGLVARGTVVAITYVAKVQGWDTHYTKFGPAGIERDLAGTMFSASFAQLGFWTPFTVVAGVLAGTVAALLVSRAPKP